MLTWDSSISMQVVQNVEIVTKGQGDSLFCDDSLLLCSLSKQGGRKIQI